MQPKILLLQARRNGDPARVEEQISFATKLGLAGDRIVAHNLLDGPPTLGRVRSFDALMIGGAGDFSVVASKPPAFKAVLELMADVAALGHPTFASCFGFHCSVVALGGEVVHDPDNTEVGTYELELTEEGKNDPLLGQLPPVFQAQLGHKDRAVRLPDGLPNLAASRRCAFQAFRFPGRPFWATQFHPELDEVENRLRFVRYMKNYSGFRDVSKRQEAMKRFRPSPETPRLLPAFLELVFGR